MDVIHGRGYVYAIEYHIVWCVKYRRKVISPLVEKRLFHILSQYASENGFTIEECNTERDHVHILIAASPQHYIPDMLKGMKGVSARDLLRNFPDLREKLYGGHMWNPSYFVATVSENTETQIRDYIQSQKER